MEGTLEGNVVTKLENETIFKSSSTTQVKKIKFHHEWTIYNFKDFYNIKEIKLQSSIFSDGTKDGLKWRLEIDRKNWEYVDIPISLFLVSKVIDKLGTFCQFSVWNQPNDKVTMNENIIFSNSNKCHIQRYLLLVSDPPEDCPDSITVLCEIEVLELKNSDDTQIPLALRKDLGLVLFENPELSVVTFSVSGKELQALKAILVARSPVFETMFSHDMQERKNSRIEITDIDYEVLKEMLRFLYTNEISDLESIADRLLIAADKYALENLKRKCEVSMIKNLTIENAAQYFIFADQHNANKLKMRAKSFIMANAEEVAETVGLKSVIGELFLAISDHQS